jgi:hypothetical protein
MTLADDGAGQQEQAYDPEAEQNDEDEDCEGERSSMDGGMLSLTAALTRSGALGVGEADRLRNELARAVRRAEAAENKVREREAVVTPRGRHVSTCL